MTQALDARAAADRIRALRNKEANAARYKAQFEALAEIQDSAGLTEWEKEFVTNNVRSQNFDSFSTKQLTTLANMVEKYGV